MRPKPLMPIRRVMVGDNSIWRAAGVLVVAMTAGQVGTGRAADFPRPWDRVPVHTNLLARRAGPDRAAPGSGRDPTLEVGEPLGQQLGVEPLQLAQDGRPTGKGSVQHLSRSERAPAVPDRGKNWPPRPCPSESASGGAPRSEGEGFSGRSAVSCECGW